MPLLAQIIDTDLPFTVMAEVSKAIALGYRASSELIRAHPVLQTNPKASSGYVRRACVDHFLSNIPKKLPDSKLKASLESNRNGSSTHIVLRSNRLTLTTHHVQSSRRTLLKNSLYSKALSSPNHDLFGYEAEDQNFDTAYGQILHGAGPHLEFASLVIPDPNCRVAIYTRAIPLPSLEEVKEEKIDDEIGNLFESIAPQVRDAK